MQKVITGVVLLVVLATLFSAKPVIKEKKDLWQTWQTVNNLLAKDEKPLLIDIYTNWCVYCKRMDANTYTNDSVYNYLKNNFYRFKFNGESKDSLVWLNKTFNYNSRYKTHDFAVYLTRGSIVYPTTVIIIPGSPPYYIAGDLNPAELELLLKFYAEKHYLNTSLEQFSKTFKPKWK